MFHACVVACMLKIFRPSVKIVFTLHNTYLPQFHRRLFLFLTRWLRNRDIIFPFTKNTWYQKGNAVTVANGVDTVKFTQSNHQKEPVFTCAFAGRLERQKNPLFLIELANKLRGDFRFVIKVAGDGSLKNELLKAISRDNLQQYFDLHGYVEDMPAFISTSHCLLLPSLWEGMPMVLLESAAAGVPVIVTPVGNIASLVNNSNGFIGAPDSFPSMLRDVMNNYGDALIKARRLMTIVHEDYNLLNSYRQHIEVYRQL
jgi:glycosyltransferase involved in cell wall biosynthesis